ncbi:MAG: efflux transporter outer membrane subunit [Puniceicoccales bacterium]|jgi:NodT family efflux transporter outer membrane factor (OMF) lipoprotein|nr:efflux transporter outer membrane subunit [Puniceicoccales bacterium]
MQLSSQHLRILALLPLVALCACATDNTNSTQDAVAIPEQWQNASEQNSTALDTEALANWWTRFNDPILDQLIVAALADSPDIRTALSRIAESRARRGVEKANLLPSLSGRLGAREDYNRNHNTHTTSEGDSYSAGLDASWEIDLFGKNRASLDAADADLAQTQENYHAAQVSLAAEIALEYISLRSSEAQLAVVNRNIETRQETTQLTQWREESGNGNALDSQQAISTLEQARATIPSLTQNISQSRNRLALLSGKTPGALDAILTSTKPVPQAPAALAMGIPAETLRQRPDIRAAEHAVEAAGFRTRAAALERLPTLNLSGSIGVEALRAGNLFSPDATVGSVLAGLVAPIFEGGRITQNIEIQNELQKQALISYESSVLTALSEVEDALVAIRRSNERLEVLNKAATAATTAANLAAIQYEAGTVDLLTVLEVQRTQLSLEEQVVGTTADVTTAHVQLYKALGGGWGNEEIRNMKSTTHITFSIAQYNTARHF